MISTELVQHSVVASFEKARYANEIAGMTVSMDINLEIKSGNLICVQVDRDRAMQMVGDACCGMRHPVSGHARFLGQDWARQPPQVVAAMRSSIGRGGNDCTWLPFLSVADNVVLAQLHHTRRNEREMLDEAASLATGLGLPGLPLDVPGRVGRDDLNRAGIVRAFMGRPKLVILEQPNIRSPDLMNALANQILAAIDRGTAVVWVSDRIPPLLQGDLLKTTRYRLRRSGQMEQLA